MSVTFNRQPQSVSIPSSASVKQNFFNQFNWKGINQNKNFMSVDQETFADAKNVYVDDEGILKSRLPLKYKHNLKLADGSPINVKDIKIYGDIAVVVYVHNNEWYIGIIDENTWASSGIYVYIGVAEGTPLKTFRSGNYIYIFTQSAIKRYDVKSLELEDAPMYEAVTRNYYGENFELYESENIFSTRNKYQYILYPTLPGTDYTSDSINGNAIGKKGTYFHYVNEDKVFHEVDIDKDYNFLKLIHQPLTHSTDGFVTTNIYGKNVFTTFIYGQMMYRWQNNRLWIASLSDRVFEMKYDFSSTVDHEKESDFVKIKLSFENEILVIYRTAVYRFDLAGVALHADNTGDYPASNLGVVALLDADYFYFGAEIKYSYAAFEEDTESDADDNKLHFYYSGLYGTEIKTQSVIYPYDSSSYPDSALEKQIEEEKLYCGIEMKYNSKRDYHLTVIFGLKYDISGNENLTDIIKFEPLDEPSVFLGTVTLTKNDNTSYVGEEVYLYTENTTVTVPEDTNFSIVYDNAFADPKVLFQYTYNRADYIMFGRFDSVLRTIENEATLGDGNYFYNGDLYYNDHNGLYLIKNWEYLEDEENNYLISDIEGKFVLNPFSKYWFYLLEDNNVAISNYRTSVEYIKVFFNRTEKPPEVDMVLKSNKIYVTSGPNIYIGEIIIDTEDDVEKLYFKKQDYNTLNGVITGLHQISDNELAIFTKNDVWYNTVSDGIYYYIKSKIVPTLKGNSDIITLPDSTTTLMPSDNGVIALNYQNFVNSTEQSTVNLTQELSELYSTFTNDVKIVNWKFYTLFYQKELNKILLYDNRYATWWLWDLPIDIGVLFVSDNELYILDGGSVYKFENILNKYYDDLNGEELYVDWYIESQKLHFGANNYYKHITNITLGSIEEGERAISLNLAIKNYRKWVNEDKIENFDYDIDVIRTYVKRLNYAKVCEFQYKLSSDNEDGNVPLALSNITIKYKIGGQVR